MIIPILLAGLEWATAGLATVAFVSAIQAGTYQPAIVGIAAAGIAGLARLISIRRATGIYSDAALRPLRGRAINDNGGAA
jgi:hypothetical protein